jgi:hypothetical protein
MLYPFSYIVVSIIIIYINSFVSASSYLRLKSRLIDGNVINIDDVGKVLVFAVPADIEFELHQSVGKRARGCGNREGIRAVSFRCIVCRGDTGYLRVEDENVYGHWVVERVRHFESQLVICARAQGDVLV